MSRPQWFVASSPVYAPRVNVAADAPPEPCRLVVFVRARSRRAARVLAVRTFRSKRWRRALRLTRDDWHPRDEFNAYQAITVERVDARTEVAA